MISRSQRINCGIRIISLGQFLAEFSSKCNCSGKEGYTALPFFHFGVCTVALYLGDRHQRDTTVKSEENVFSNNRTSTTWEWRSGTLIDKWNFSKCNRNIPSKIPCTVSIYSVNFMELVDSTKYPEIYQYPMISTGMNM